MRSTARNLGLVVSIVGAVVGCAQDDTPEATVASVRTLASAPAPTPETAFTAFESGQVRPLALSASRRFLYAANTPDNRIEIFHVHGRHLQQVASVPVGLEPVALAERREGELWVVNHLSDSVSVVDVRDPERAHVVRTLLVGDEPRDIVFAGPGKSRAFVTTAHRGQNTGAIPNSRPRASAGRMFGCSTRTTSGRRCREHRST